MKVAILSPESLPIPARKGGAVEGLIESIIECNEDKKNLQIDIFTIADDDEILNQKICYKASSFVYFKKNRFVKLLDNLIMTFVRRVLKNKEVVGLDYIWKLYVVKRLKKELWQREYDAVMVENALYLFRTFKDTRLYNKYKGKVFFHVHNKLNKESPVDLNGLCCEIISISDYLHDNIRKYLGTSVPIKTVYNGVDTSLFSQKVTNEQNNEILNKLGLSKDCFKIVFVGRIAPEKGVKELVTAFKKIHQKDFRLILVGSCYFGSETASGFEKEIHSEIKTDSRIIQTGFVYKNDIWKYYSVADVVVLPSMWEEPLGLTMIEAQLSGTPLVTTKSGGIVETVDARYSILLDRNKNISEEILQAILTIYNNQTEWIEKGKMAGNLARNRFSEMAFYNALCDELQKSGDE